MTRHLKGLILMECAHVFKKSPLKISTDTGDLCLGLEPSRLKTKAWSACSA